MDLSTRVSMNCGKAGLRHADIILADEELLEIVYRALQRRHPRSGTYGRPGTPAEVVLRMLLLKHVRDWSFVTLEREVRGNLVYREFTRVGAEKVPDAKTMGRLAQALPPEVIEKVHARMVAIAQDRGVVSGKGMRVDTTVVEINIHYPTDSSLLGDGVRVLTGLRKRVTQIAGEAGTSFARSHPQCATSLDRNRAGDSREGYRCDGEGQDRLSQTGGSHRPGRRSGKEVFC
jgi:IS5 family transposase